LRDTLWLGDVPATLVPAHAVVVPPPRGSGDAATDTRAWHIGCRKLRAAERERTATEVMSWRVQAECELVAAHLGVLQALRHAHATEAVARQSLRKACGSRRVARRHCCRCGGPAAAVTWHGKRLTRWCPRATPWW